MENVYPDSDKSNVFRDKCHEKNIFEFCGSPLWFHKRFFNVTECSQDKRIEMLNDIEKEMEKFVLDPNYCPYFG